MSVFSTLALDGISVWHALHAFTLHLLYGGWSEFKGTAPNDINIFIAKENLKVKKHYILMFIIPRIVTVSIQTFIPLFYKLNTPFQQYSFQGM
jgi:hypothetical protein